MRGGFGPKEKRKNKKGQASQKPVVTGGIGVPTFEMPRMIEKKKKEK